MSIETIAAQHGFKATGRVGLEQRAKPTLEAFKRSFADFLLFIIEEGIYHRDLPFAVDEMQFDGEDDAFKKGATFGQENKDACFFIFNHPRNRDLKFIVWSDDEEFRSRDALIEHAYNNDRVIEVMHKYEELE